MLVYQGHWETHQPTRETTVVRMIEKSC
jgi:hypothetical protein